MAVWAPDVTTTVAVLVWAYANAGTRAKASDAATNMMMYVLCEREFDRLDDVKRVERVDGGMWKDGREERERKKKYVLFSFQIGERWRAGTRSPVAGRCQPSYSNSFARHTDTCRMSRESHAQGKGSSRGF